MCSRPTAANRTTGNRTTRNEVSPLTQRKRGPDGRPEYRIVVVDRVVSILSLLQQSVDGVAVAAIADATGLPSSSVFRYLRTLEKATYVERDPATAAFRVGPGFVGMQSSGLEVLRERVRPWLQKLRDELKETTSLGILDDAGVIYVDIIDSRHVVRLAVAQGSRDPLHSTALGKAIAAGLSDDRVREMLDRAGMPERTPTTITTIGAFRDELARVRELGYAVDNGENDADVRGVAVPILTSGLPAAISLSAPAARFPLDKVGAIAAALRDAADRIAAKPTTPAPPERPAPRPGDRRRAHRVASEQPETPARRASSAQGRHGESAMSDEHQSLVTTGAAATQVGVDRCTLVRWWQRGIVMPEFVTPGGHARWRVHSLLRQLQDRLPERENSQLSSADGEPGPPG